MPAPSQETLKKRIKKDLTKQLKEKNILGKHYEDLIQDYLSLWELKCKLIEDIKENGINVAAMHGPKSNPSIGDLHKTNDRMLKILDALGLKAASADGSKSGKNDKTKRSSSQDLI